MRYKLPLVTFLILALVVPWISPAWASTRAGRNRALDSVVQVIVETRFDTTRRCSGFIFSNGGQVLTNYHTISDAVAITVLSADAGVFEVDRIRRIDPRADVAVLNLKHREDVDFSSVRIGDSRKVQTGDDVFVIHNPAYGDDSLYATTLTGTGYPRQYPGSFVTDDFASEMILFKVEGPFDVGSAGGVICNADFDVIGLIIGGETGGGPDQAAYAIASYNFESLLVSSHDVAWDSLRTNHASDAEYFDRFFGPSPQVQDYQAAMPEGYIAWFAPVHYVKYADEEFTSEINDKIDKNWFATDDLEIDGRPLREWSASRIVVLPAYVNPWDVTDTSDRYVHFDADSQFSKRIYVDRDTEERIMTRHILAMALEPGAHTVRYINRGANYKATGLKRQRLKIESAKIELLDIQGLSFVSMLLLPSGMVHAGEGEPVRYELERRPLGAMEINSCIRQVRYPVDFQ